MTVEACKAGKDVYVEKPSCTYVEEGQKMVDAARQTTASACAGCSIVKSGSQRMGYSKRAFATTVKKVAMVLGFSACCICDAQTRQ